MSLSDRLEQAQQDRARIRLQPDPPAPDPVMVLARKGSVVLDLTTPSAEGVSYDPVRNGDASSAFGTPDSVVADHPPVHPQADPCPRCSGPTQVDLVDQVHQTASLSCLDCFHMFRVRV